MHLLKKKKNSGCSLYAENSTTMFTTTRSTVTDPGRKMGAQCCDTIYPRSFDTIIQGLEVYPRYKHDQSKSPGTLLSC